MSRSPALPEPLCYQGELFPERVEEVLRARLADEKVGLKSLLIRYKKELESQQSETEPASPQTRDAPFSVRGKENEAHPGDHEIALLFHDKPVAPPQDVEALLTSIMLDLGEIPPDYLVPAGDGAWTPRNEDLHDRHRLTNSFRLYVLLYPLIFE